MFVPLDRRLLYGLVVPSTVVIIGGIIWYRIRRKSLNENSTIFCFKIVLLDEQVRLNRSEYLVLEVQVPDYCIGSIIGKGGEVIKRVRSKIILYFILIFFPTISFSNNFPFVVLLLKKMKKFLKKIIEY